MLLFEDHRSESATVDHKSVVHAVAFSPDGSTLATGAKDGAVFVRDSAGRVSSLRERGPKCLATHAVGFLPDNTVVAGGAFGWLGWKPAGDGWQEFGPQSNRQVTSIAVLTDKMVAFGIGDRNNPTSGTFELWDISADRPYKPTHSESNGVWVVAACPARKLVAWATGHKRVCVWDITTPRPFEFPQKRNCPAVALSSDGRALAVADDYTAKIYDIDRRRERVLLKGHAGKVVSLAFSPDGRTLMTGSWDQTVRLWDTATGRERANYKWDIGRVYCVTYAPDGLRLAAGGDLGRVVVWDAE
jgi:WD40 repeat protein